MRHVALSVLVLATIASFGNAERIDIRRDTVLEATSDQDINIAKAHEGDRFTVTLREGRDVPRGIQLEGEVLRVEPKRGDQAGYIDLQFNSLMAQGSRPVRISALPISLDDRKIRRDRDGRLTANSQKHRSEHYVFGGLLGGLLVGSLVKKPFEGAFAGTLAGIIFSELERDRAKKGGDTVLKRGSKLGVLFTEDVTFDADDRGRYGDSPRSEIEYDGRTLDIRDELLRDRGQVLIPLTLARQFEIDVDESGDRIYLERGDALIRLTVGSSSYRIPGRTSGQFSAEVRRERGVVYVPAEALAAVLPGTLRVDGMIIRPPS